MYVIKAPKRDELQAYLKENGIGTGIHYPVPIHMQKALEFLGYRVGDFPETEKVVKDILSLPMYAEISDDQINYVSNAISVFYAS